MQTNPPYLWGQWRILVTIEGPGSHEDNILMLDVVRMVRQNGG
jgi:hypothetical protein